MLFDQLGIFDGLNESKDKKRERILILILLLVTGAPSFLFWLIAGLRRGDLNISNLNINFSPIVSVFDLDKNIEKKLDNWWQKKKQGLPGVWSIYVEGKDKDFHWFSRQDVEIEENFYSGQSQDKDDKRNLGIAKGVPQGIKVNHKVLTAERKIIDIGLVSVPKNSFILGIKVEGLDQELGLDLISEVTNSLYWVLMD